MEYSEEMSSGDGDEEGSSGSEEPRGRQDDGDFALDPDASSSRKPLYRVLDQQALRAARDRTVESLTSMLCIPDEDAMRVLRKYKWDVDRAQEEWFSNDDAVRKAVGLQEEGPPVTSTEATCMVCFDSFPVTEMAAGSCRHFFCKDCWRGYIHVAIAGGPASLDLRCPIPKCGACVPGSVVRAVASPQDVAKWEEFALRSFVEDNNEMSWCVGQGCNAAVQSQSDRAPNDPLDISCTSCGSAFCFACKQEAHRPTKCDVVKEWLAKNSAESENVTWIMVNTKQCPKCHRPIEKNHGCMHMTCTQCKFEFCWLCSGDWKEHGERTGGYYNCNRFETAKKHGEYDDNERKRETAKQSLERYMHYFERWDAHQKARNKARLDASNVSRDWLERLSEKTKTPSSQLKFITDAWSQIIDCRRILSWTYTYGFYQYDPNKPDAAELESNKVFFEFLQGDAEKSLERLHEAAETELKKVMEACKGGADPNIQQFLVFRTKLIGLTDVTRGYFTKLVQQLEKGLQDMSRDFAGRSDHQHEHAFVMEGPSGAGPSETGPSGSGEGDTSAGASGIAAAGRRASVKRTRATGQAARADDPVEGVAMDESAMLRAQGFWACPHCTFCNTDVEDDTCAMCQQPRVPPAP